MDIQIHLGDGSSIEWDGDWPDEALRRHVSTLWAEDWSSPEDSLYDHLDTPIYLSMVRDFGRDPLAGR